ncbi:MAG TPA: TetR/AcrR family transcriptional regulator [Phenylobacterium sp.]|nr:TetR/AcrR family transcriptional regulator [Phenylobacterium sp.]
MPRKTDARRNALIAAERLFREKGYAATGLTEILAASGSPKGSFYFHFPEGKAQLADEVLQRYGARIEAWLKALADRVREPRLFTIALCDALADEMAAAGWRLGCAAQNIANEAAPQEDALAMRAHQVFESWLAVLEQALGEGLSPPEARRRAVLLLSGLQGARGLARASGSREAFEALKGGAEEPDRFRPDPAHSTSGPSA